MKNYTILKILLSITICLAVGGLSGYLTSGSINTWYVGINKPSFNPPNWIFGPVWTILYTLMGVSAGLIWSKGLEFATTKKALSVFGIHLALNFSWSLIFFWIGTAILGFYRNSISSKLHFLLYQCILLNFSPYWMVTSPLHFMGKFRYHVKWSHAWLN